MVCKHNTNEVHPIVQGAQGGKTDDKTFVLHTMQISPQTFYSLFVGGAPCYHAPSSISPVLQHMLCNQYVLLPMVRSHPTWQPELPCCFQKVLIHCCCFVVSRVFAIHNHMTEPIYSTVGDQPPSDDHLEKYHKGNSTCM